MSARSAVVAAAMLVVVACHTPREQHYACPSGEGEARQMGWISDPASAFNESELRGAAEAAYLAPDEGDARAVGVASLGARYSGETITFHADINPALVEGWGGLDGFTLGNLRVGLGLRTMTTGLGGLYRRGLAIRAALGIDPVDASADRAIASELVLLRPFDRLRFASGQSYEQMLEARYELIGCHAPFVHVHAGVRARKDAAAHTFAVPFSVAVGAHANAARHWEWLPHATAFVEYSGLVGHIPETEDDVRLAQRVRLGVRLDDYHLALHFDNMFGVGSGWIVGTAVALPLAWGRTE